MKQHEYRQCLLCFMYDIMGDPSKRMFCTLYETNLEEVNDFINSNDAIPIHWLDVIYKKISKPKEYAFMQFFTDHIEGVLDLYVSHKHTVNDDYVANLTTEQKQSLLYNPSVTWQSKKKIVPKTHLKPKRKKRPKAKKSRRKRTLVIKKEEAPTPIVPFPDKKRVSKILKSAFTCASQGGSEYSIETLRESLFVLIPQANIHIDPKYIIFCDHENEERDRFNVPKGIDLR